MTQKQFKEETRFMLNGTKVVNGVNIACVGWRSMPWMIIENEETWEDVRRDNFVPIDHFLTKEDLMKSVLK
jgi:hypothetical protein